MMSGGIKTNNEVENIMRMDENTNPEWKAMLKSSNHGRKALEEIESLREQLSATEEWKEELRKANNEFGSETECWPGLWKRIAELKRINGQEYRDRLECEKEIESLRQDNKKLRDMLTLERECVARDYDEMRRYVEAMDEVLK